MSELEKLKGFISSIDLHYIQFSNMPPSWRKSTADMAVEVVVYFIVVTPQQNSLRGCRLSGKKLAGLASDKVLGLIACHYKVSIIL